MTNEEFIDLFTMSQSPPGVFAINTPIFVGHRLKGYLGAVTCVIGTTLPSFIIIPLLVMFYQEINGNVWIQWIAYGICPAAAAITAIPVITT